MPSTQSLGIGMPPKRLWFLFVLVRFAEGGWVLSQSGDSCWSACKNVSDTDNATKACIPVITTESDILGIASALGVSCTSMDEGSSFANPSITSNGTCSWKSTARRHTCNISKGTDRRMCCCGKAGDCPGASPADGLVMAKAGESCATTCGSSKCLRFDAEEADLTSMFSSVNLTCTSTATRATAWSGDPSVENGTCYVPSDHSKCSESDSAMERLCCCGSVGACLGASPMPGWVVSDGGQTCEAACRKTECAKVYTNSSDFPNVVSDVGLTCDSISTVTNFYNPSINDEDVCTWQAQRHSLGFTCDSKDDRRRRWHSYRRRDIYHRRRDRRRNRRMCCCGKPKDCQWSSPVEGWVLSEPGDSCSTTCGSTGCSNSRFNITSSDLPNIADRLDVTCDSTAAAPWNGNPSIDSSGQCSWQTESNNMMSSDCEASSAGTRRMCCCGLAGACPGATPFRGWEMSASGMSCSATCGSNGCARVLTTAEDFPNIVNELSSRYVGGVGKRWSCSSTSNSGSNIGPVSYNQECRWKSYYYFQHTDGPSCTGSSIGHEQMCCCGTVHDCNSSYPAEGWVLAREGASCSETCGLTGCARFTADEADLPGIASNLGVSCSSSGAGSWGGDPSVINGSRCSWQTGTSECDAASNMSQRMCCCGHASACPGASPVRGWTKGQTGQSCDAACGRLPCAQKHAKKDGIPAILGQVGLPTTIYVSDDYANYAVHPSVSPYNNQVYWASHSPTCSASGSSWQRLCCCGDAADCDSSVPADGWVLAEEGISCSATCNTTGCIQVTTTAADVLNTANELGVSCNSTSNASWSGNPAVSGGQCSWHTDSNGSSCEESSPGTRRMCCCGSASACLGASAVVPGWMVGQPGSSCTKTCGSNLKCAPVHTTQSQALAVYASLGETSMLDDPALADYESSAHPGFYPVNRKSLFKSDYPSCDATESSGWNGLRRLCCCGSASDCPNSRPADGWTLSKPGESCSAACGLTGCANITTTDTDLPGIAESLGVSCSSTGAGEWSGNPSITGGQCSWQASEPSCGASSDGVARMCCCGRASACSGAAPAAPGWQLSRLGGTCSDTCAKTGCVPVYVDAEEDLLPTAEYLGGVELRADTNYPDLDRSYHPGIRPHRRRRYNGGTFWKSSNPTCDSSSYEFARMCCCGRAAYCQNSRPAAGWVMSLPGRSCTDTCGATGCALFTTTAAELPNTTLRVSCSSVDAGGWNGNPSIAGDQCSWQAANPSCEASMPGVERMCCCGRANDCPGATPAPGWTVGHPSESCTSTCGTAGCARARIRTEEEMRNLTTLLRLECSSISAGTSAINPSMDYGGNCFWSSEDNAHCDAFQASAQRMCCCGTEACTMSSLVTTTTTTTSSSTSSLTTSVTSTSATETSTTTTTTVDDSCPDGWYMGEAVRSTNVSLAGTVGTQAQCSALALAACPDANAASFFTNGSCFCNWESLPEMGRSQLDVTTCFFREVRQERFCYDGWHEAPWIYSLYYVPDYNTSSGVRSRAQCLESCLYYVSDYYVHQGRVEGVFYRERDNHCGCIRKVFQDGTASNRITLWNVAQMHKPDDTTDGYVCMFTCEAGAWRPSPYNGSSLRLPGQLPDEFEDVCASSGPESCPTYSMGVLWVGQIGSSRRRRGVCRCMTQMPTFSNSYNISHSYWSCFSSTNGSIWTRTTTTRTTVTRTMTTVSWTRTTVASTETTTRTTVTGTMTTVSWTRTTVARTESATRTTTTSITRITTTLAQTSMPTSAKSTTMTESTTTDTTQETTLPPSGDLLTDVENAKAGALKNLLASGASNLTAKLPGGGVMFASKLSYLGGSLEVDGLTVTVPKALATLAAGLTPPVPGDDLVFSAVTVSASAAAELGGIAAVALDLSWASGSRAKVAGLAEPVGFTLPVEYNDSVICAYWDEEELKWSTKGVVTTNSDGGEQLSCETTHFSLFGAILRGLLTTIACANFDLFREEGFRQIWTSPWYRTLGGALVELYIGGLFLGFLVAAVLDQSRSKTYTWNAEFFLVPSRRASADASADASAEATTEGGVGATGTAVGEGDEVAGGDRTNDKAGQMKEAGCQEASMGAAAGSVCDACCSCDAFSEALDDVCSSWFEYFAEVRTFIVETCGSIRVECVRPHRGWLAIMGKKIATQLLLMSARRSAGVSLRLSDDVVDFILNDVDLADFLTEEALKRAQDGQQRPNQHGKAKVKGEWRQMTDQYEVWFLMRAEVCQALLAEANRDHTYWERLKTMGEGILCQNPIGALFLVNVFQTCKEKVGLMSVDLISALCFCCVFFQGSGMVIGKPLGDEKMCSDEIDRSFGFRLGRFFVIATTSFFLAGLPVVLLESLQTKSFKKIDGEIGCKAWNRQLRVWKMQENIFWAVVLLYDGLCVLYIVTFVANISPDDHEDWSLAGLLTLGEDFVALPILLASVMPLTAKACIIAVSRLTQTPQKDLVRKACELLHKQSNMMLPRESV